MGIIIDGLVKISNYLPEIKPSSKEVPFKIKMAWTGIALVIFFILGQINLIGLNTQSDAVQQIMFAQTVLASNIGTLITTGIGPIVMASIFLQLFVGSGLINIDMGSPEGKAKFQSLQKVLAVLLCFIEAYIYVGSGLLVPVPGMLIPLVAQIALGSLILLYFDEILAKYGIGSGVSLFIAAGVSGTIFWQLFRIPFGNISEGILWNIFANGELLLIMPIIGIIAIFLIVVFAEGMHINIPITMGRKGTGGRYPVKFLYVSNMPVILAMALFMNVRLWAMFLDKIPILNTIMNGVAWAVQTPTVGGQSFFYGLFLLGINSQTLPSILQAILYIILLIITCIVFGWFWVQMGNQSTESVANQLMRTGGQIPGFRKDKRVIQKVLGRYIPPITVLGSIFVALLAGFGDLVLMNVASGTGILLTVGIIYRFYEEIAKSQADLLAPLFGKMK